MLGRREREDRDTKPRCPFCHSTLGLPENIKTETGEFAGGRCACGAVYACDPTGHNVGEMYLDALLYACEGDWDKVNSLGPDNYAEAVFNYEPGRHMMREVRDIRRDSSGKIIFIKLKPQEYR